MLTTLELFAAGACMGSSMTGFAVNGSREPATAYIYNLIMMVIGTIATSLVFMHGPGSAEPIYLIAMVVIAGSLAIAAARAFATRHHLLGAYLTGLSAAVAIALSQTLTTTSALSSGAAMFS
ncbi:MAG: hypothetical protein AAGJ51_14075 [Pseudomonadota bacterium]